MCLHPTEFTGIRGLPFREVVGSSLSFRSRAFKALGNFLGRRVLRGGSHNARGAVLSAQGNGSLSPWISVDADFFAEGNACFSGLWPERS